MSLYVLRARVDLAALGRWAGERAWGQKGRSAQYDEGLALHHLLAESFGKGVLQPFRLLASPGGRAGNLYAYSAVDDKALGATAAAAMLPDSAKVLDPNGLDSKPMPNDWQPGQRLGFDLRLRPVVRVHKATGVHPAGAEVDAFLAEARRDHPDNPTGMEAAGRSRETVYVDWLGARLDGVARLETAHLVRFRRSRAVRHGRIVEGPDAVIQGDLVVTDPAGFAAALARGIGRHRAYGYGMVLLRPAGTRVPTC